MTVQTPGKTVEAAKFLRRNWQVAYAAFLIAVIPLTIVLNTFFVVDRFRRTVDVELQRTALMAGRMFNALGAEAFSDPVRLQANVEAVAKAVPEMRSLEVLAKDGDDFTVVASLSSAAIGRPAHGRQNVLAWYDSQAIAYLTKSGRSAAEDQQLTPDEARSRERFWGVVMPLRGTDGEKAYLLSAKLSLGTIDELVRSNLFWSYVWLAITVLVTVLVLAANTRLFQYAALYRKLQEVDQMKDDFISMASHELRAPITAVRGYVSLFLDDAFGKLEGKARDVMGTTGAIAAHLSVLVDDLLDVSRIEQGRMKLEPEDIAVAPLIDEIMGQMRFEAEKKGLAFERRESDPALPAIRADRSRIKQVLINLVSNAIKYTPSGSVTVTAAAKDGGMVEIRVIDTGLGMSAEAREKLFQKFYRVRTDATATIPGTGLGLWITKRIVELMGGRIYCDSIEKVGTQMSVLLPAAKTARKNASDQDKGAGGRA